MMRLWQHPPPFFLGGGAVKAMGMVRLECRGAVCMRIPVSDLLKMQLVQNKAAYSPVKSIFYKYY